MPVAEERKPFRRARGDRPIGVKEVAERAEVAISSVSRVLTGHPNVSQSMRKRVMDAAEDLGYEPDFLAQSLRRGQTFSIGFVVRDISNPVLAELALGAETALSAAGYSMLVVNSHGDADSDAAGIHLLRRRRVDGLLLSLSDEGHESTRQELQRINMPVVLIDRVMDGLPELSSVLSDHAYGARAAIQQMIKLGHRRIGLVNGPGVIFPMQEVERVVREVCSAAGVELIVEAGALQASDGEAAALRMLDSDRRPTAMLSASNQILVGALHAIRARGLHVPDDISLVTFDDIPLLDLLDPPIAVISRQPTELGRRAAEQLVTEMRDGTAPRTVVTDTIYDPRGSIGPPPSDS